MPDERPIWVTGAGGFLGAAVCRRLMLEGRTVQPLCHGDSATSRLGADALPDPETGGTLLPSITCDLEREAPPLPEGVDPPAAIAHFAAAVPRSGAAMEGCAARNERIDATVFDFAASVGAGVAFASGGNVYGPGRGQVFIEDGPVAPADPYAEAKLASERRGAETLGAAGSWFAALRISAPYGPGLRAGTVVRRFLTRALAGDDLRYHGSGSRMQDFIWVEDVAEATARCLEARSTGVFNVASGAPVSMVELAALVADVVGERDGDPVAAGPSGEPDPQEGRTAVYAIEEAARAFGWRPRTSLRRGLELWRDHLGGEPA